MRIDWFELKLLDTSTNHTSRTEVCRYLIKKGFDVRYHCGYRYFPKSFPNLPAGAIRYCSAPNIPGIRGIVLLFRLAQESMACLLKNSSDIIIYDYMINLLIAPIQIAFGIKSKKAKIVLDIRTLPAVKKSFRRQMILFDLSLKLAKKTCDAYTFITKNIRDYCRLRLNINNKGYAIWNSGFDEQIFDPARYLKKFSPRFELFYHGEISMDRGIGDLVLAVRILINNKFPVNLTMIGSCARDRKLIVNLIAKNGLKNYCKILEPVPIENIPQMIKNCDLPVIPHPKFMAWEVSSPIKIMEYMAMGKPMVLTDIRAHRNIVGNSEFAFYAKTNKPGDLALEIEKAYRIRHNLENIGGNARKLALEKYTWKKQTNKIADLVISIH